MHLLELGLILDTTLNASFNSVFNPGLYSVVNTAINPGLKSGLPSIIDMPSCQPNTAKFHQHSLFLNRFPFDLDIDLSTRDFLLLFVSLFKLVATRILGFLPVFQNNRLGIG